jgi:hypothetical protein
LRGARRMGIPLTGFDGLAENVDGLMTTGPRNGGNSDAFDMRGASFTDRGFLV